MAQLFCQSNNNTNTNYRQNYALGLDTMRSFLRATNQSLISFSYKVQVIDSRYESIVWSSTELWLFFLHSSDVPLSLDLLLWLSPSRHVVVVTLIAFRAQLVSEHLSA